MSLDLLRSSNLRPPFAPSRLMEISELQNSNPKILERQPATKNAADPQIWTHKFLRYLMTVKLAEKVSQIYTKPGQCINVISHSGSTLQNKATQSFLMSIILK